MKKSILIFGAVIITFSLTAFGVINWNELKINKLQTYDSKNIALDTTSKEKIKSRIITDFIYDVGPRFGPIKKSNLDNAKFIDDFIEANEVQDMVTLKSVNIIIIKDDKQSDIHAIGYSRALTDNQIQLLQQSDYSTNFLVRTEFLKKNKDTGILEDSYLSPHLTVVPEKQAEYANGKQNLINYLKDKSLEARADVQVDKLQPAKLYFTVTKTGTIENVTLDRSSNYLEVDKKMIELITKLPGKWKPAVNNEGENVDQELVVSFGLMGC